MKLTRKRLEESLQVLSLFIVLFWVLELLDVYVLGQILNGFGIVPRTLVGLRGVLLAPFLHAGLGHLAANTVPFAVLGGMILVRKPEEFPTVSAFVVLISGLGTWLVAPAGHVHLGASGLVFGYFGFLVMKAWLDRDMLSIAFAIIGILLYGGIIWGLDPFQEGISWQMHLFGMLGGGISARFLIRKKKRRTAKPSR